ncbi:hypothetical protein J2T02_002559 [Chitinophaga terrae (ex Kim and Jung 2007)]|uniref:hypothetical protein n=1 Tax=Chitinophaga terrae (ex Kim and Jung 2007) TaxID=408074 RepID=UPI00277D5F3A|nr:hypothetical protein [Chitinophaga terrae (ex Kim and Jung 2007)]MDQ0107440.1 hypothetical protein [Chitinophaga terrae (ex Kim and Jung 2007)]
MAIHADLAPLLNEVGMEFYGSLLHALNKIDLARFSSFELKTFEEDMESFAGWAKGTCYEEHFHFDIVFFGAPFFINKMPNEKDMQTEEERITEDALLIRLGHCEGC